MDTTAKQNKSPIRVLMSPWLGYGHISPYLQLAKKLSNHNFKIYITSSPATLTSIQNNITKKFSNSIKLVPLKLPTSPDLPLNLHTTNALPPHLMPVLIRAFAASAPDFSNIFSDLKPDLLIYDILQPWAPLVARDHNIPAVHFITCSSTLTSFTFHYLTTPHLDFPFSAIFFRDYEAHEMNSLLKGASDPKERDRAFEEIRRSCSVVLIKGFREIEGKYIDYVAGLVGRKFVPVGPLVQLPTAAADGGNYSDVFAWLEKREKKSTVLVTFGSEYFLKKEDMDEIANGLESSGVSFIWVVRFPTGSTEGNMNILGRSLPEGFVKRVGERGVVVEGWAPQTRILRHPSIGGFVSHCGWSSVMESMYLGVPIIALPMQIDQPMNARLVGEVGVGVEVLRDRNRRLHGGTLAAVIRQVVFEEGGEMVRRRAVEMREKLRAKGDEEIDEVVKELVDLCTTYS